MSFLTGSSRKSWQPVMSIDTTTSSYWLNWRVLLCSLWVLTTLVFASILISKYEARKQKCENDETAKEPQGLLYADEVWRPCLEGMHPVCLLGIRVVAFFVLLVLLILNVAVDGGQIMYYYTQWTFTLVTIYFGLGSVLSMNGCYQYHNKLGHGRNEIRNFDAERGMNPYASIGAKYKGSNQEVHDREIAGFWGYVFQILFQMNAGAVMLTDCVFWFIIVPFLEIRDYNLNFLIVNMHTTNAVFLLVDTALNSLRFPWFRIAYFYMWTSAYVVFQWILHACVSLWWPYPFLDLSSSFAPLWYSTVALMHIPCFGIFVLVIKLKHNLFTRWFPESYQCSM